MTSFFCYTRLNNKSSQPILKDVGNAANFILYLFNILLATSNAV